jgi:hypothetical protein
MSEWRDSGWFILFAVENPFIGKQVCSLLRKVCLFLIKIVKRRHAGIVRLRTLPVIGLLSLIKLAWSLMADRLMLPDRASSRMSREAGLVWIL